MRREELAVYVGAFLVGWLLGGCGPAPSEAEALSRAYVGARELACSALECPEPGAIYCARTSPSTGGFRGGDFHCSLHWERTLVHGALQDLTSETYRTWEVVGCNDDGGCWFEFPGTLMPEFNR